MSILQNIPRYIEGDRAEKEWGWKPSYSLEEMVDDFIKEFRTNLFAIGWINF